MENNELVPYEPEFDFSSIGEPRDDMKFTKVAKVSTLQVQQQRINEAIELVLVKGLSVQEFREYYSKLYGVSQRTADKVWAEIKKILRNRTIKNQDEIISAQLGRYQHLYQSALEDGNKRVAREALWDMSRIMGLDQRKIDITSGDLPLDIKINLSNNPKDFQ